MLVATDRGLYCPPGDFYVDPWRPVERAVITHAHSDHARHGSASYLAADEGAHILRQRLGPAAPITTRPFGAPLTIGDATVSLHPAGHVRGSAQVRIEHRGQIWVVSGDYKRHPDPTCTRFEPVHCHTLITESTFGLPVYRWPDPDTVRAELLEWARANAAAGRTSIVFAYALGKAQRVLAMLAGADVPLAAHGSVHALIEAYRADGAALPPVEYADASVARAIRGRGVVLAPPSAAGTVWIRKFGEVATAGASGWMRVRGARRWRNYDRGFVLSDHADWPGLLDTIRESGASRIGVTHGYAEVLARWLREHGTDAWSIPTSFRGEAAERDPDAGADASDASTREPEPLGAEDPPAPPPPAGDDAP